MLLENTMQKQRKGGKLEPLWMGPYSIQRDLGKGLYELANKDGKILKKKANIARLKHYLHLDQESPKEVSEVLYSYSIMEHVLTVSTQTVIILHTYYSIP